MAPATKYGGKIVACHPGTMLKAKSKLTIVCTERTSGVAKPASNKEAVSWRYQCTAEPRQPIARKPYMILAARFLERSRNVARSGSSPINQNSAETVA